MMMMMMMWRVFPAKGWHAATVRMADRSAKTHARFKCEKKVGQCTTPLDNTTR